MSNFQVEFYALPDGSKPAKEFVLGLDKKMRAKMLHTIEILEDKGNKLRMPYSEHLDDGIFEIRAKVGSDISRVLYFLKTPPAEIERAKLYRKDYLERMKRK